MRFILTLATVMGCATFQFGQDVNQPPQRQDAQIETSYDRIKKLTTVSLVPMQVYGEPLSSSHYIGRDQANFSASFTHFGRTLRAQPRRVLFSLTSTSQDWKYSDFRKLSALVDGLRLSLGPMEHVPSFTVRASANANSDDYISQGIDISVPYKTFVRIANGKEVRIRMGPREFKLTKNHLEALRDLAVRMVPLSAEGELMEIHKHTIGERTDKLCATCKEERGHIVASLTKRGQILRVSCPKCGTLSTFNLNSRTTPRVPRRVPSPYDRTRIYHAGQTMTHAMFGDGEVTAVIEPQKIDVLFPDRVRRLIHSQS